jgi:hypothetical protein
LQNWLTNANAIENNLDHVIEGMLRRSKSIHTGHFHYKWGKILSPSLNKKDLVWGGYGYVETVFDMAEDEFAISWPATKGKKVIRKNFSAAYTSTKQNDEKRLRVLTLSLPLTSLKQEIYESVQYRFLQAGIVPCNELLTLFEKKREHFSMKDTYDENNSVLLEIQINKSEFRNIPYLPSIFEEKIAIRY